MPSVKSFGVLGGDERMRYLAASIASDGYRVYTCGLEKLPPCEGTEVVSVELLAEKSDVVLLPVPVSADGRTLNAPFSTAVFALNDAFASLFRNKLVYGGMLQKLYASSSIWQEIGPEDCLRREELAVGNAIPTAEGALGVAIREYPGTVNGAKCLVTGFGRIGKNLALLLRGMGAKVSVVARKKEDLMLMRAFGVQPLTYRDISERYDLIFNTVPACVLDARLLRRQSRDTLIVELASAPGGVDRNAAADCGIQVIDAPSLPGKTAPKTAAEYIKEAVYNMLEE